MESPRVVILNVKRMVSIILIAGLAVGVIFTYFIALEAFVAPSHHFPLDVIHADTLDVSNVSSNSFNTGEKVHVNITVEMAGAYYVNFPASYYNISFLENVSYRIIITIMDPSKRPVFTTSDINTVSPNSMNEFFYEYTISAGAPLGAYKVRVMVWSDWLPGGLALSEFAKEVTFDVA